MPLSTDMMQRSRRLLWRISSCWGMSRQAYNAGADAFIREAIRHDLMPEMKKEWSTALDERVCKECQALEGVQISMDDSFETQSGRRNCCLILYISNGG